MKCNEMSVRDFKHIKTIYRITISKGTKILFRFLFESIQIDTESKQVTNQGKK